jgi:hypothetical protein
MEFLKQRSADQVARETPDNGDLHAHDDDHS